MSNEPIRTYKKGELVLRIWPDEDAEDPRNGDNLGTMVCFHRNYTLGDKTGLDFERFGGWDAVEYYLRKEEKAEVILLLYLLDHSGITMRTRSFHDVDPGCWDSGMVGFIYTTKKAIREMIGKDTVYKSDLEQAREVLEAEVKTYDQYLRGEIYGYTVVKPVKCEKCGHVEEEVEDTCWGFYDMDTIVKETGFDGIKEEE